MLKITSDFYKNLYEEQNTEEICQRELLSSVNKYTSSTDKAFCDDPISLHELEIALKELPLHKSPGLDGLPAEFYRSMWETIKMDFHELITEISNDKELTFSQKRGAIRIVFKKQQTYIYKLKYYRPITLLNTDVKIITKVLAMRLKKILPSIIDSNQTCVPGRNISKNVHTLQDVIMYANSENITAAILFIDQEKAFDRVSHTFLLKTLEKFNFGSAFISWIQIILTDIKSQVKVNGYLTDEIDITRGIRQGCPISTLLYVLIAEVFGIAARKSEKIKGVKISGSELKILQYADDTEIFATTEDSIKEIFNVIGKYERGTGAKINVEQTEGLWLGSWKQRTDKPFNLDWKNSKVKCLGIWIGNEDTTNENFIEQQSKVKNKLKF